MSDLVRCSGCAFPYGKLVGHRGRLDSPLAIVGESPGVKEIQLGAPFVGPSGDLLKAGLAQHPDVEPYITNAMICFPGTTKTKTQDKLIAGARACTGRLEEELSAFPREVILAMGNAALWACTGNYDLKITQVRGKVFPSPFARRGVVAAVHPAFLLRGGGSLRQWMADVDYALSLTKGQDFRKYVVPKLRVLQTADDLQWLGNHFRELPEGTPIAADTETGGYSGFDHLRDHILCAGFSYDPNLVYVVPEHLISPSASDLYNNGCRFVWHNGKFDAKFFRAAGISNVRVDEDTMLLSYALDEVGGQHDLEQVASDLIGAPDWKFMIQPYLESAKNNHPKGYKVTYADIPKPVLHEYMSKDISSTIQIFPILRRGVTASVHLEKLYTKQLMPMSAFFTTVEEAGLEVDLQRVEENKVRLGAECDKYQAELNEIAVANGMGSINPGSWQQVQVLLYDKMQLKINKKRPTSTDEDTLLKLPKVPAVVAMLKFRKVRKALGTYANPVPEWIGKDGKVHTTLMIHGTVTGRPASRDPNILNIPRDPFLRGMFVAGKDERGEENRFLEVDINQAELRVLAELSGDERLLKVYNGGGPGIHDVVTLDLFGKISEYTPDQLAYMVGKFNVGHIPEDKRLKTLYNEQKMKAKNVNFGIPYGITAFGLSDQIDSTPQEAQKYLDLWYKNFPQAHRFLLKCREAVTLGQRIITPFGRMKRFGCVSEERLSAMQNEASNFPMQSIASDIMMAASIYMQPRAAKLGVPVVNSIYDAIIYRVPNDPILIKDLALETMEAVTRMGIERGNVRKLKILADSKLGYRWGSLEELKFA